MKRKNLFNNRLLTAGVVAATVFAASCKKDDETTPTTTPTGSATATTMDTVASSVDHDADANTAALTLNVITVKDLGEGTGTVTWSKTNTYVLNGRVFVNDGQTLTIEAGTVIKGKAGVGENASALIVARGGKIMADGTSTDPIIFTTESDPTARYTDGTFVQSKTLNENNPGMWGGLIVLGKSGLNSTPGETAIEGIPTSETRGLYGGTDDADNSGSLKYISIRHGGSNIGADNEINGLTLGGVGSGTTIDYVEVYANSDDGIEFFGGTAQVKHALVAHTGDDSYDYDEGFRGKGQFWVSLNAGDRNGEHDGGTDPETATPYATPTIYNATYIGGAKGVTFRDNAGGKYVNSIFSDMGKGIDIEDLTSGEDSKSRLDAGDLVLDGNVMVGVKTITDNNKVDLYGNANVKNTDTTATPGLTIGNPVPATALTGATGLTGDSFIENVTYKGAFSGTNWAAGWTRTFAP